MNYEGTEGQLQNPELLLDTQVVKLPTNPTNPRQRLIVDALELQEKIRLREVLLTHLCNCTTQSIHHVEFLNITDMCNNTLPSYVYHIGQHK